MGVNRGKGLYSLRIDYSDSMTGEVIRFNTTNLAVFESVIHYIVEVWKGYYPLGGHTVQTFIDKPSYNWPAWFIEAESSTQKLRVEILLSGYRGEIINNANRGEPTE